MPGLQLQQTRAGDEKEKNPREPSRDAQTRMKQFHRAEAEQDRRNQIGSGSDEEITNTGENGAEPADEILRRMIGRREITPRHPRGQIFGRVGDQGEKEQCSEAQQDDCADFVPRVVLGGASHFCPG